MLLFGSGLVLIGGVLRRRKPTTTQARRNAAGALHLSVQRSVQLLKEKSAYLGF
jgi:hypothetical protein